MGGDGAWALGNDDRAYRIRTSWDTPGWQDVYAVDLDTGKRTLLLRETQSRAQLSAGGRFAYWWDSRGGAPSPTICAPGPR